MQKIRDVSIRKNVQKIQMPAVWQNGVYVAFTSHKLTNVFRISNKKPISIKDDPLTVQVPWETTDPSNPTI